MVKWLHRSLCTEQATHTRKDKQLTACCAYQGRKVVLEEFSGIPVKALLENDEETTELHLSGSAFGDTEACVLAECLKVIFFFFFFFFCRAYSWNVPLCYRAPVTRTHGIFLEFCVLTGQRNAAAD